ncbi:MAG: hypothetical protein RR998_00970 [Oscillospiraceae bacterium]
MGFFKKLLGLGVAAGATVAAVKVAQKYEDNRANAPEPTEAEDVSTSTVLQELGKAASDVYTEASSKVKEVAESAGVDTAAVSDAVVKAGKAVGEAGKVVAVKVKELAGDAYDQAIDKAGDALDVAKEKVGEVYETAKTKVNEVIGSVNADQPYDVAAAAPDDSAIDSTPKTEQ